MQITRTLALALVLAAPAAAQQFLYGINMAGKLTVNGTVLDTLPTEFDEDSGQNPFERWFGLAVSGPDRYALRLDGRVHKNGKKLYDLNPATDGTLIFLWRNILATDNAHVHLLRQEGLLNTDGVDVVTYPRGTFFFTQIVARDILGADTVYALRSDGSIFTGLTTNPVAKFTASTTGEPADGASIPTSWIDLSINTAAATLVALRADGELWSETLTNIDAFATGTGDGDPPTGPPGGVQLAALPFPALNPNETDLYVNLEIAENVWRVLRTDGALFTPASVVEPLADYAGTGSDSNAENFLGLLADGTDTWALRADGLIFKNEEEDDPILNLVGTDGSTALALGTEPPDLTNFKNPLPTPSPYTAKVLTGETLSVPVLVSDIEKTSDDLLVELDPNVPLPAGVTFQEDTDKDGHVTRTLEWDGSGPAGTYPCKLTVDDDDDPETKPKKFTTKIVVLDPDLDPEKNKLPVPSKVKKVQALVDHEVVVPVLATDKDGDTVTISVDTEKKPFSLGAVFDDVSNTFSWTPTFDDIGSYSVKFKLTDGIKTKTLTIKVKVVSSLIFEEPEPEP
jgi:hypothetical protein